MTSFKAWQEKVDKLALRERFLIFCSVIACVFALVDTLWLGPAQTEQRRLSANLRREDADLDQLRNQLRLAVGSGPGRNSAQKDQEELAVLRSSLEQVNRDIAALQVGAKTSTGLSEVLVHFLRQQEGLSLIKAATLADPVVPVAPPVAGASRPASVLRHHGVELTVGGSYAELAQYVRSLEQALPNLHWGRMVLSSNSWASRLTLQVSYVEVTN
jgi:MSHA biogenesis protein MshJ